MSVRAAPGLGSHTEHYRSEMDAQAEADWNEREVWDDDTENDAVDDEE